MKYRSRTDIISMILQAAMNGATKTRLMYSAFLSYAQVQEYLHFLMERKMVSFEQVSGEYKLTAEGLRFLRVYDEIAQMVSLDGNKSIDRVAPNLLG
jgi:predicted transcriptional regulator